MDAPKKKKVGVNHIKSNKGDLRSTACQKLKDLYVDSVGLSHTETD